MDAESKNNIFLTRITSARPRRLSKGFRLRDGTLEKLPGGAMSEGTADKISLSNINELADVLTGLNPAQALVYGISEHDTARVVTKKALAKIKPNGGPPTIARTREHFHFPNGAGIFMNDNDPGPGQDPLSADDFRRSIYKVCPEIETAPHVLAASASSFIHNGDECLRGAGGWRMLIAVRQGTDIGRAGDVLFKRSWLKGLGHIFISKSGAMLPRSIVDASVWDPEGMDFCAGAECQAPLEQRRPAPQVFNADAQPLDTASALPSLTMAQEKQFAKAKGEAIRAARPEADEVQEQWVNNRVQDALVDFPEDEQDEAAERLREIFTNAAKRLTLLGDFTLKMADGSEVTVGEILDNPEKYHGKRCADPLEPDYGNDSRIGYINLRAAGRPYIYSHAHGGRRYTLHRARKTVQIVDGERFNTVGKVLELIRINGAHYNRGGEIVTVNHKGQVSPRDKEGIQFDLDGLAKFERYDRRSEEWRACDCKPNISSGVMAAKGRWEFPKLVGIATAPILDPVSGRLIDSDGYDEMTGLLMILNDLSRWPGIPAEPTVSHVEKAVKELWKPFIEFPFDGPVSRGVFLAKLLTAVIRALLPTAPGFCDDAPTAGSGKTLLAKSASELAGDTPAILPNAGDGEEIRKRILALLRENRRVLILDNVVGILDSAALCAMLTAPVYSDRVLGVSETITVPTNSLLIITGNNVTLRGDLCRRVLRCRIDPASETPWKRRFDLDPADYCRDHRLEMVAAALTIIRAGMQNGPEMKDRTASFELWSDTVRRAVCLVAKYNIIDCADPVDSIDTSYEMDPETSKLHALLAAWWDVFEDRVITVAELIRKATDEMDFSDINPDLRAACDEIAGEGQRINSRRLGRWIERNRERIVNNMRLESPGTRNRAREWRLRMLF
jgi:hypothetical protein